MQRTKERKRDKPKEIEGNFMEALAINDKPVLIEFVVDPDEMVFPMVPAGGNNNNVILSEESYGLDHD